MQELIFAIQTLASPFIPMVNTLTAALAGAGNRAAGAQDATVAAFAVSSGLVGLLSILFACWCLARLRQSRVGSAMDDALDQSSRYFRRALLERSVQGVVVLHDRSGQPEYYGEGQDLYEACLASPQSEKLLRAVDTLADEGTTFRASLNTAQGNVVLRGVPVAGRPVLYLDRQSGAAKDDRFREIFDVLPIPVWIRDRMNVLTWGNTAFLTAVGCATIEEAVKIDAMLDWSERDLVAQALAEKRSVDARTSVIVNGDTRVYSLGMVPVSGSCVAGFAAEVTEDARLETKLQLACDAQEDMVEKLPVPVAVFNREQKLTTYNRAYSELWGLPRPWLDTGPTYGEIIDRLRDTRRVPEQVNFVNWKNRHTQTVAKVDQKWQETWHLPNGKSIRIVAQPHLQGGVFLKFADITERLQLESSLSLLTQVQKATLDTLDSGIAIFGTDGRLVLHNGHFADIWRFTEAELTSRPHLTEIDKICTTRIGRDCIWGLVSRAVNSPNSETLGEKGKTRRGDGRLISLSLSNLPNGATVASFTDLTDLERFGSLDELEADVVA